YNTMRKQYGDKCKLLMTDTDSLMYQIHTEDAYKDMESMKTQFDFSDYQPNHFLFNNSNKKVIGKFKDETNGTPVVGFRGNKPKMYSFKTDDLHEHKKAKGVKKYVVKSLGYADYDD